jgi:hypothetical protein
MENEIQVLNTEIVKDTQFESQIDIAKRYPRDLTRIINNSIAIVTMDKETAETCNYNLPRAGKKLSGASVHLARIIVQQYGNLRVESKVTHSDSKQVYAEAVCFDLESNVAVKSTTSKSIINKNGGKFTEDMVIVTGKAAAAIAYRNAVFSVIPKAIVDKVYNAAMREITGDLSTEEKLIKRRKAAFDTFKSEFGVEEKEILDYLGINTINQVKQDEIVILLGMFNSLRDGESTVVEMFNRKSKTEIKVENLQFDGILKALKDYDISLKEAHSKYKNNDFTDIQKAEILKAGTIDEKRIDEIIKLVIEDKFELGYFEFFLNPEQFEAVKQAVIDNELAKQK